MKTDLFSVSKIFTERLLRIPDYQRGYAWAEKQLKDYWNDLIQLDPSKNHYIGVLTLEYVPNDVIESWTEDHWIIKSKKSATRRARMMRSSCGHIQREGMMIGCHLWV